MLSCTFNSIYYFILVLSKHTKMMLSTLILHPQQSANLYIFCHTPPLLTLSACHKHIFTPFLNLFSSGNALTQTVSSAEDSELNKKRAITVFM